MPWHVAKSADCPASKPWAVILDADGSKVACHASKEDAQRHVAALYANTDEPGMRAMSETETMYRSFHSDLHIRSDSDGRTICGIVVPYNAPTRIDDRLVEQFTRGAFAHQMGKPSRVRLEREHIELGGTLIGAGTLMRDEPAGLYMELRASKTPTGDETLELVRDGALNQLSIKFRARQNRQLSGGVTERIKADLAAVAVVMEGAYGDLASVVGIRSASPAGTGVPDTDLDLRMRAEEYLLGGGLPEPSDHDLAIRSLRLGLPF